MAEQIFTGIIVVLLISKFSRIWRNAVRYARRKYIWHSSTQRLIDTRRHWRKTGFFRIFIHRSVETIANLIDSDFKEWKKATNKNNTKLYREGVTYHWRRNSQANIEDCLINTTYTQFLRLEMDEDYSKYLTGEKPANEGYEWGRVIPMSPRDEYKHEFDKHIELIDNKERYESVMDWGYKSNIPPFLAAKVFGEKKLQFPEDFHYYNGGYDLGHVYRYIDKHFPDGHKQ